MRCCARDAELANAALGAAFHELQPTHRATRRPAASMGGVGPRGGLGRPIRTPSPSSGTGSIRRDPSTQRDAREPPQSIAARRDRRELRSRQANPPSKTESPTAERRGGTPTILRGDERNPLRKPARAPSGDPRRRRCDGSKGDEWASNSRPPQCRVQSTTRRSGSTQGTAWPAILPWPAVRANQVRLWPGEPVHVSDVLRCSDLLPGLSPAFTRLPAVVTCPRKLVRSCLRISPRSSSP